LPSNEYFVVGFAKASIILFLFDRAKAVHDAMKLTWKPLIFLRTIVCKRFDLHMLFMNETQLTSTLLVVSAILLVPVFAYPTNVSFHGRVTEDGYCIQLTDHW
jgi:hypothetical protein